MADFGEGFELCKIPNEAELIGIERHSDDDHVILTFKNKVVVYNIADRKIVNSWSVEAKERFTCPVVHHDESFFGVRDDEWLLQWDTTIAELWESSMVLLRKPPKRVHVSSSMLPVLVYNDNEALPIEKAGKETKGKKSKERLLWCGTHKVADNVCFSKALTSQDGTKVSLVMHLFSKSKQQVFKVKAPEESQICCWSLVDEAGETAFFVSLWSNGCLYKTEIPAMNKPESELCCEHLFNICDSPTASSESLKLHLSHVALSFVCVATSDTLSLWDTKFQTCHSQKPLKSFMKSSASSSLSGACYLQSTPSYIILANDSSVFACSYTAEKSTLKSSLGVLQKSNKRMTNIKPQFLTTPKLIKPNQSVEGWTNDVEKKDVAENEILCRLLDSKKTKTAKKLASELQKHLEKLTAKESDDDKPTVSEYFVTSVFERCMKEKDLWSTDTGRVILKMRVLPQRCISQFFSLVLENKDTLLFQDCFHHLHGIPESTLVECLRFLLKCNEDVFPVYEDVGNWTQINSPCSLSRAKYISLVLAHPINDAFLQNSLRKLQFEETLLFMKFLLHLIKCWSTSMQDILHQESCDHKLSYAQVLDWAAMTLNAHFTQLILIPEAQSLLVNLHKVIAEQITTYELLGQLDGHLKHFKEHEPLPKNDRTSAYTIETMDL